MIITIKKGATKPEIEKALLKLEKRKQKTSLKKYFDSLKCGLDGLKYQFNIRHDHPHHCWNRPTYRKEL